MQNQKKIKWRQVGRCSADCMLCVCSHPQEYTEEFRDIAKGRSKEAIPGIMLINQRPVGEDLHVTGLSIFLLQYFCTEVFKYIFVKYVNVVNLTF
jgi:hypothetical protein